MKQPTQNLLINVDNCYKIHKICSRLLEISPYSKFLNLSSNKLCLTKQIHINNSKKILEHIRIHYPDLQKLPDPENSTAYHYSIRGHQGNIGIIAAFSRTFCGTCNRIRLTAQGILKTCLYDDGVINIRDLMRAGISDQQLTTELLKAFNNRPKDGLEAEQNRLHHTPVSESMSTIGG